MIMTRQSPPTEQESIAARHSRQHLSRYAREHKSLTVHVKDADHDDSIELPAAAVSLLMDILGAMASGQGITLIPENVELTTVQAAGVLNVSRPYFIKLLDAGQIPYRKVGKHRRILMEDVIKFQQEREQQQETALDQLVAEAQEHNMGYE